HNGDHSAADLALLNLLAFWTGKDTARMDQLFRQSGLMRPKWDERRGEQTYGERTIASAISGTRKVHTARKNDNRPVILPPEQPEQPEQADFSHENHDVESNDPVPDGDFKTGTTGTALILPYFLMKKVDGTLISAQPELAKQQTITAPGLWYVPVVQVKSGNEIQSRHGDPVWISIPFDLLATTDDGQGHGHGVAIRFAGVHGHVHTWTLPRALLVMEGREIFQMLYGMGFHMSLSEKSFYRLREYLNRARSEIADMPKALSVSRTGWAPGARFVLPDRVFGSNGVDLFYQSDDPSPSPYTVHGTFDGWREQVAMKVAPYDLPVFSLSCAFAAPLLKPLRIESGGFHVEGNTSTGKTSAQRWALSVWGSDEDLLVSWNSTRVGSELLTAAYSDTLLVFDEIGQARDARLVGQLVYDLCNGTGKTRGNARLTHRANLRWRTLLLSSGEKSLAQMLASVGAPPPVAGQETRMAHIHVDAGDGCGILTGLTDPTTRKALLAEISAAAKTHYGHAARKFLNRLTTDQGLKPDEDAALVKRTAAMLVGAESTNEIDRVALRFALVGFAGELATRWGITGWPQGRALEAAIVLFKRWRSGWGSANRDETLFLIRLDEWLSEHRPGCFYEIDPLAHSALLDAGRRATLRPFYGFTSLDKEMRTFYLNAAGWKALTAQAGKGVALKALSRVNRLVAGGDGDGGKKMRIAGELGRFYVIHGEGE
ncbi:MAG: DUF927 domain-containing protein, partial [Candidatus Competibacter sp.]|nr:DUF927 domain-containing protein [Candidatus Competibacter sp.]